MKLYIAGPMRGKPEMNFPAFLAAAAELREHGHEVRCPAEPEPDFDPHDLRPAIGNVLHWIATQADAVILLPGWERSRGARAEMAAALAVGITVHELAAFLSER